MSCLLLLGPVDLARFIEVDNLMSLEPEVESDMNITLPSWGLERVGLPKSSIKGRGVHVYVLDTGIRLEHEDFGGRAFAFFDAFIETTNKTGLCTDSNLANCSGDVRGHGSH